MGEQTEHVSGKKLYKYCMRCGRRLKSLENRQRGMGRTCWEKCQVELTKKHMLF